MHRIRKFSSCKNVLPWWARTSCAAGDVTMMFKLYAVVVLITSTAGEVAKYFDEHVYVHVCLSLCVSVSVCPLEYLPYYTRDLYLIFVRVAYGCGSVLLRRGDEIPKEWAILGVYYLSTWDPYENGWTDQDAVWVNDSDGPKEPCITWGADSPRGMGNFRGCPGHTKALAIFAVEPLQRRWGLRCNRDNSIASMPGKRK